jgi:hypothetical protein
MRAPAPEFRADIVAQLFEPSARRALRVSSRFASIIAIAAAQRGLLCLLV